jgi:hypothetical protein
VYVNYSSGVDNDRCGPIASPCKNIDYALEKATPTQEVRLLYSSVDFPSYAYSLPAKVFKVVGMPQDTGDTSVYPQLYMDFTKVVIFNFSRDCKGIMQSYRVVVNSPNKQATRYFFFLNSNGNSAYFKFMYGVDDCFGSNNFLFFSFFLCLEI